MLRTLKLCSEATLFKKHSACVDCLARGWWNVGCATLQDEFRLPLFYVSQHTYVCRRDYRWLEPVSKGRSQHTYCSIGINLWMV